MPCNLFCDAWWKCLETKIVHIDKGEKITVFTVRLRGNRSTGRPVPQRSPVRLRDRRPVS